MLGEMTMNDDEIRTAFNTPPVFWRREQPDRVARWNELGWRQRQSAYTSQKDHRHLQSVAMDFARPEIHGAVPEVNEAARDQSAFERTGLKREQLESRRQIANAENAKRVEAERRRRYPRLPCTACGRTMDIDEMDLEGEERLDGPMCCICDDNGWPLVDEELEHRLLAEQAQDEADAWADDESEE